MTVNHHNEVMLVYATKRRELQQDINEHAESNKMFMCLRTVLRWILLVCQRGKATGIVPY